MHCCMTLKFNLKSNIIEILQQSERYIAIQLVSHSISEEILKIFWSQKGIVLR